MRTIFITLIFVVLGGCLVQTRPAGGGMRSGPVEPAPPGPGPRPRGAVLSGLIRNATTGQPVNGASVDITSPALGNRTLNVQTGPDGWYRTEPVPPGDFAIRVRRDGYVVIDQHMHVGNVEARLDIELQPKR